METVCRTIRYRLHPRSASRNRKLFGTAGACRFVWNHFVAKLEEDYERDGKCDFHFYSTCKVFTNLRKVYPWLPDYASHIVRQPLKAMETCYKEKFKQKLPGKEGLPRFKGKFTSETSFPLVQGSFKMNGDLLHISKIGNVKLIGNNPYSDLDSKVVSGTVKFDGGRWYAYLVHKMEVADKVRLPEVVGIDRNSNIATTITLSDGTAYPRYVDENSKKRCEMFEARKRRYQRMMSRRQRGSRKDGTKASNRYLRARAMHQKTCLKIVNERKNRMHHISKAIADKFGTVYLEDLKIKNMTASAKGTIENPGKNVKQKSGLNKSILNSGWGILGFLLKYKTNMEEVPPHYTSQTCSRCGHIDKENRKTQDKFECRSCGYQGHADVNAALNILALGKKSEKKASGVRASARGGCGVGRPVKRENSTQHVSV